MSADSVFRIADAGNEIKAPFFDIEDEYFVKSDLWLIASVAFTLMDLFYGVNQGRDVIEFRTGFADSIGQMAEENNALLAEMKTTDRFKRAMQKFGPPDAT